MATSITINGRRTNVPGTAADPRFISGGRGLPQTKTLALVGSFSQFENGVAHSVRSVAEMGTRAPGDDFLEQLAALAFNPASDPLVGAPGEVLVFSDLPSTAAAAMLLDVSGRVTVAMRARVRGGYGNALRYTFTANPADASRRDLTLARQGSTETLSALGSGAVVDVTYSGGWADDLFVAVDAPVFDDALGDATGRVRATLRKRLAAGGGSYAVPVADAAAAGAIALQPVQPQPINTAVEVVSNLFTAAGHGLSAGDPVRVTDFVGASIAGWTDDHIAYVLAGGLTADTFSLGETPSGAAIDVTGVDGTAVVTRVAPFGVAPIGGVATAVATGVFTSAAHGLLVGDRVTITSLVDTTIAGHTDDRVYYVVEDDYGVDTFRIALTDGGAALALGGSDGTCTVSYVPTTVTVTGLDSDGLAAIAVTTLPVASLATVFTAFDFSRVDSFVVSDSGAGAGLLDALWTVIAVDRSMAPSLAALASILGDVPNIATVIRSVRAASYGLADLDFLASTAAPVSLTANASAIASQIGERSRYVTAERVLPTVAPTSIGTGTLLGASGGSTVTLSPSAPAGVVAGSLLYVGSLAAPLFVLEVEAVLGGGVVEIVGGVPADFSGTPFVAIAAAPVGEPAPVVGTASFAGGAAGVADAASRQAVVDAIGLSEASVIACVSYDTPLAAELVSHADLAAGVGEKECNVWLPLLRTLDLAGLDAATAALNTRHVAAAAESIRVVDSRGNRRVLDSRFTVAMLAAIQAALPIGEPLTNKRPRILDTLGGPDWTGQTKTGDLIDRGVVCFRRDGLGWVVARSITTFRSDDDVAQVEVSANESAYWQIRDMREELRAAIGRSSGVFYPAAIVALVEARARRQLEARLIADFDFSSIYYEQNGDTVVVGYGFAPNVPINFAIARADIRPVRFEFNIS